MTNKHPYADILQYLIEGGDVFDIQIQYKEGSWFSCSLEDRNALLLGIQSCNFRIKPKTVMFNGLELPMYETKELEYEVQYYMPNPIAEGFVSGQHWYNDSLDTRRLERGLIFLKEGDAVAWGKAMCPKTS